MIVLTQEAAEASSLQPGGVYVVSVGDDNHFPEQVRSIWMFLTQASHEPMGLELQPDPDQAQRALADLAEGTVSPSRVDCTHSFLAVFTSGTTGTPKRCEHQLQAVLERKRGGQADERWLLTYAPYRWAGLSVLLHVLKSRARLVVPESLNPQDVVAAAIEGQATHVTLTPSTLRHWQLSCAASELRELPLRQVTFGGEAATQPVLDAARALWPAARITHVYASTEFGDVCSVSDGVEGVPCEKFDRPQYSFQDNGELVIGGRPTGDLWERRDDRYVFFGRVEEVINVGGAKVSPLDVERAALKLPGITGARAFPVPSPLVGQLVALEYQGTAEEADVRRALREVLPKVACPAELRQVTHIAMTAAGKTSRRIASDE